MNGPLSLPLPGRTLLLVAGIPYAAYRPLVHLLWLHVDAAEARRGQHRRGRLVPDASLAAHARRAADTAAELRSGPPVGWSGVTVLDRPGARAGLRLETAPPVRHAQHAPK